MYKSRDVHIRKFKYLSSGECIKEFYCILVVEMKMGFISLGAGLVLEAEFAKLEKEFAVLGRLKYVAYHEFTMNNIWQTLSVN